MAKDVAATWAGIEAWAGEERPEMLETLRGPADADALAALRDCGLPVPESLLQSLAIHDGEDETAEGGLFPHGIWLSAAGITQHLDMMAQIRDSLGEDDSDAATPTLGPVKPQSFSEHWLPIIDANGDIVWYLDFDPAPGGVPGQVIRVDAEGGEWMVCAPDYAAFLAAWHDDLVGGRLYDEDGEPVDEGYWPPYERAPAFQPGMLDEATLFALGEMGRWDEALTFADRLPPSPTLKLRLQSRAHQHDDDPAEALRALDALAALGEESTDDLLVRIDVLDNAGQGAAAQAALEAALAKHPAAALYVRRAALVRAQAENPPVQGRKAQMKWLASPAGQQAIARSMELAVADYDAALALEDRFDWRVERIELLLDAERWDEAETAAVALIAHIESRPGSAPRDAFEQARDLIERAQSRGEDRDDGEDMVASMDELLKGFQDMLGGKQTEGMANLKELRDALAGLVDDESRERAELDADPESTARRAREIADNIARMHAEIPERYAPFDASTLDRAATRWYDGARDALVAQGFTFLADVEPLRNTEINGQSVLMRLLQSADRHTIAAVWRLDHPLGAYEVVDMETELDDGRVLITNNAGTANPFTQPESIETLSLARGTTMPDLVAAHLPRLAGRPVRPLPDLDAIVALQERQRVVKRDSARARGWVSDGELRSMLGASYHELADAVRGELATRL